MSAERLSVIKAMTYCAGISRTSDTADDTKFGRCELEPLNFAKFDTRINFNGTDMNLETA